MAETSLAIAKDYPVDKFNLLIPVKTMQELSPLHKLVINEVQVSPNIADKDTYKEKNGELALTKKALMKLMAAANIQILDSKSVPTQRCNKCIEIAQRTRQAPKCFECPYIDDVAYQVTIAVPEPSGTHRIIKATKEIRMEDEKKKAASEAQFNQFKPFRTEHCESKALNRALREGLMLKSSYTAKELEKPFAVALVMPNMSDPDLKKAMIANYANQANALYGNSPAIEAPSYQALPIGNVTEIPPDADEETGEVLPPSQEVIDIEIEPPTPPAPEKLICATCSKELEGFKDKKKKQWTAEELADYSEKNFGRRLCKECLFDVIQAAQIAKEMEGGK